MTQQPIVITSNGRGLRTGVNPQQRNQLTGRNRRTRRSRNWRLGRIRRNRINTNRNRRIMVLYGRDQDLAFNSRTKKLGKRQTISTPVSESNTLVSFFKFTNNIITLCQPVPSWFYNTAMAVVPLNPMFYPGRTVQMAQNFANYQILNAKLHYVPLIGTTSTGMIAMSNTRNCLPISYNTATQYSNVTQLNAQISPVWMCTEKSMTDMDKELKNMNMVNRKDVPNTFYVVGNGLAGNLSVSGQLYIEMSIQLSRPVPTTEVSNTSTTIATLVGSAAGWRSDIVFTNGFGIVVTSTASNIDVGELIKIPAFPVVATDYLVELDHNGIMTDTVNSAADQGTLTVIYYSLN